MIRSTRAVCKRISLNYSEMSDNDSVIKSDTKISKRQRKALFLKNLDGQVEATKKKVKREQAAYISTITCMYNTLIGKIPKALQDTPVNEFIANDGQIEERPEAENIQIISRPSEIVNFESLPQKRLKGKTPAKPEMLPSTDSVVSTNNLLKSKENLSSKLKTKKKSTSSSKSTSKQTSLVASGSAMATPMASGRPKRTLRSNVRNMSISTTKTTKSKAPTLQKSTTPFLTGTASAARKSNMTRTSTVAASTAGRKRTSSQRAGPAKVRKIEASPLRQQNQSNASQFSFESQRWKGKRNSPDENAAPAIESITLLAGSAQSARQCRPGEKVFRLPDSACPLTESQPTFICPLEDGNALTISNDTDFASLTLPKGVMDNLRSFQKKLCDFLKINSLADN